MDAPRPPRLGTQGLEQKMAYYNVPTTGAATRRQALREFARRESPATRQKLTSDEFRNLQDDLEGLCYQGNGGATVYIRWADLTNADVNLIVK
jgi:hypothetical protein